MSSNLYADAQALGADRADAGYDNWECRISDAIAAGATSGEILMALRWSLSQLIERVPRLEAALRLRAAELVEEIDRAFS